MARRLTDTYFVKCSFSVCFETSPQRLSQKTSTGVYVIPDNEVLSEYIKTTTERQVKDTVGDNCKIADFVITEITPL